MKTYKTTSLADQVFEKLENDIIQGIYPRGELLTELKLVEQLGVSRTPIREALRRLEQEHLIEDAGKGSRYISYIYTCNICKHHGETCITKHLHRLVHV